MPFAFLHTADWQIGKPFAGFDEHRRALLREARVTAIDRLAEAACAARVRHVLVAGDVFDSSTVPDLVLRQTLAKLAKHADISWHLLPGNHDPARAGGVWDRLARFGLPSNVVVHLTAAPRVLAENVVLLPAPLTAKSSSHDPTAWMDHAETPPGTVRIGLAHGSVQGFGSEGEAAQRIAPDRPRSARLAYLALGDWHGALRVGERIWYSGTPEPDRHRDNDAGFALVVHVEAGAAPPRVERVPTAKYLWTRMQVPIEDAADVERLEPRLAALAGDADRTLLRLDIEGSVTLTGRARLEAWLERVEARLFHLDGNLDALVDRPEEADLQSLGDAGLRAVAERLRAVAADAADPERALAALALRHLIRLEGAVAAGTREAGTTEPTTEPRGRP